MNAASVAHTPTGCAMCPLCERLCNLTGDGRFWSHKARRVGPDGEHRSAEQCDASGMTPQEAAR